MTDFYIMGQHGVLNLRHIKVWADNGLVHVEDQKTGYYESMHWRVAAERVAAISDFNGRRMKNGSKRNMPESRYLPTLESDLEFCEAAPTVIRQAREQGGWGSDGSMVRSKIRSLPTSVRVGMTIPKASTKRLKEFPA